VTCPLNNILKRDIRPSVVFRKMTNGFRSDRGAQIHPFARMGSRTNEGEHDWSAARRCGECVRHRHGSFPRNPVNQFTAPTSARIKTKNLFNMSVIEYLGVEASNMVSVKARDMHSTPTTIRVL
jgi:hypothetical protein